MSPSALVTSTERSVERVREPLQLHRQPSAWECTLLHFLREDGSLHKAKAAEKALLLEVTQTHAITTLLAVDRDLPGVVQELAEQLGWRPAATSGSPMEQASSISQCLFMLLPSEGQEVGA